MAEGALPDHASAPSPEIAATQEDHSLATRLAWVTGLRLAFLALLLTATATFYLRGQLTAYPLSRRIVFMTIATGFGLAGLYAAALRMRKRLSTVAWTAIALDQITWTAIVYVS